MGKTALDHYFSYATPTKTLWNGQITGNKFNFFCFHLFHDFTIVNKDFYPLYFFSRVKMFTEYGRNKTKFFNFFYFSQGGPGQTLICI